MDVCSTKIDKMRNEIIRGKVRVDSMEEQDERSEVALVRARDGEGLRCSDTEINLLLHIVASKPRPRPRDPTPRPKENSNQPLFNVFLLSSIRLALSATEERVVDEKEERSDVERTSRGMEV
ncbi:hypothetical protein FXO37_12984 [Capsicum annuum]|nr:hypothetical protein FXO37_12984 [Capsicum annuum]